MSYLTLAHILPDFYTFDIFRLSTLPLPNSLVRLVRVKAPVNVISDPVNVIIRPVNVIFNPVAVIVYPVTVIKNLLSL